jgi:hypothetical protein
MPRTRQVSLIFLAGVLLALVVLGSSLSNLQVLPGAPFPGGVAVDRASQLSSLPRALGPLSLPLLRGLLALTFIFLTVFLAARILVLANWGFIIRVAIGLTMLLLIISLLPQPAVDRPVTGPDLNTGMATPPSVGYSVSPLGQPPELLIRFVIIVMGLALVFLLFMILKTWQGDRTQGDVSLRSGVEEAVFALKSGRDVANVIINCYQQMSRALQHERGIMRDQAMTVGEFEELLAAKGFPESPVQNLTRLFEKARYGIYATNEQDETHAIESLNAIVQYCRAMREDA